MATPQNTPQGLRLKATKDLLQKERLPSFKSPRDLTLGSIAPKVDNNPNKKQFKPNLNAVRSKNRWELNKFMIIKCKTMSTF